MSTKHPLLRENSGVIRAVLLLFAYASSSLPGMVAADAMSEAVLSADLGRSYVLETEISAVVTIHGNGWVLQATVPRGLLPEDNAAVPRTLAPEEAMFHTGPNVHIAFRVPAGPPLSPAYRDHVTRHVEALTLSFRPSRPFSRNVVLVALSPFAVGNQRYLITSDSRDGGALPLRITGPLP